MRHTEKLKVKMNPHSGRHAPPTRRAPVRMSRRTPLLGHSTARGDPPTGRRANWQQSHIIYVTHRHPLIYDHFKSSLYLAGGSDAPCHSNQCNNSVWSTHNYDPSPPTTDCGAAEALLMPHQLLAHKPTFNKPVKENDAFSYLVCGVTEYSRSQNIFNLSMFDEKREKLLSITYGK